MDLGEHAARATGWVMSGGAIHAISGDDWTRQQAAEDRRACQVVELTDPVWRRWQQVSRRLAKNQG